MRVLYRVAVLIAFLVSQSGPVRAEALWTIGVAEAVRHTSRRMPISCAPILYEFNGVWLHASEYVWQFRKRDQGRVWDCLWTIDPNNSHRGWYV